MAESTIIDFDTAGTAGVGGAVPRSGRPDKAAMRIHLVEKASEIVPDTPMLINMVSKRVRQLNNGRSPLIPMMERMGAADIALTEIIEGKIVLDVEEGEE